MGKGGGGTPKPTAYEKTIADIAMKELTIYETRMAPFRDNFIKDVTRDTAVHENRVAGEVSADFAQASKGVRGDPSLGANTSAIPLAGRKQALATVSGTQAVRDTRVKGMQAGLDLIQGDATTAELGLANIAKRSVNEAIADGQNDQARSAAIGDMVGSVAGAGAAVYKNSGTKVDGSGIPLDRNGQYQFDP